MGITDEELIYNIYLGNGEALRLLYFRFEKKLRKILLNYEYPLKKNGFQKDDYGALIWESVGKALRKYNLKQGSFYSYCSIVLKMDIIDILRKKTFEQYNTKIDHLQYDDVDFDICESFEDSGAPVEMKYDINDMIEMIKGIGNESYLIMDLLFKGYSYKEISSILNISEKKISNMVYYIRKKIKILYEK